MLVLAIVCVYGLRGENEVHSPWLLQRHALRFQKSSFKKLFDKTWPILVECRGFSKTLSAGSMNLEENERD